MIAARFFAAAGVASPAARPVGGGHPAQVSPPTDHERLTAGTAEMWRTLAAVDLRWGRP